MSQRMNNVFVDDEAAHSKHETEDDEGKTYQTGILYAHRHTIPEVDYDHEDFNSEHDEDTHSEQHIDHRPSEKESNQYWNSFVQWAEARGRKFQYQEQRSSSLEGGERLWEIGYRLRTILKFGSINQSYTTCRSDAKKQ